MHKKNTQGLSLIELVVTVAIFAVLASLAVPNLQSFMRNNRLTAATNALATSLNLSRSEAVKRGQRITLCAGSTASCTSTDWEDGWVILADGAVLRAFDSLSPGYTLRLSESSSATELEYWANGTLGNTTATFTLCDDTGEAGRAKAINLNLMGRPSRAEDTNNDGTVEDVKGNNVGCP